MEFTEVLLNGCYGGFGFSELAKEEYKKISSNKKISYFRDIRTDPKMINIVKKFGKFANGEYSKIYIEKINSKLINYFTIHEYDGQESLDINIEKYILDRINYIISQDINSDIKIIKIKEIINEQIIISPDELQME